MESHFKENYYRVNNSPDCQEFYQDPVKIEEDVSVIGFDSRLGLPIIKFEFDSKAGFKKLVIEADQGTMPILEYTNLNYPLYPMASPHCSQCEVFWNNIFTAQILNLHTSIETVNILRVTQTHATEPQGVESVGVAKAIFKNWGAYTGMLVVNSGKTYNAYALSQPIYALGIGPYSQHFIAQSRSSTLKTLHMRAAVVGRQIVLPQKVIKTFASYIQDNS